MSDTLMIRVTRMEANFDSVTAALKENPASLADPVLQEALKALNFYSVSGLWLADYEADEQGLLPKDLMRGVLSQDGLYDLLQEAAEFLK